MSSNETISSLNETMSSKPTLPTIIVMVTILACICILGVIGKFHLLKIWLIFLLIGNLIVLIVAVRKQNYRFVTNCYIINLAITDLLFLLISVPLTTFLGVTNTWILTGFVSCSVHIYLALVSTKIFIWFKSIS
jgi:hypothetical protein